MTISTRLDYYLTSHAIPYQMIEHHHSNSSIGSAISAHIPLSHIAKAVILKDHEDKKIMAVLPANNKISLSALNEELRASLHLIKEKEVYSLFNDCEHGAIPPVGGLYNMRVVCDLMLSDLEWVYIEAGDHQNLLRLTIADFESLIGRSKHLRFSREVFH